MIRIASGQGYWGDWPQAPALQVRSGPIDYMVMDYLAEVTMSIMHKQRQRDPNTGYATDFVSDIGALLPEIMEKNVKVIASAGGVNPRACARALLAKAEAMGVRGLKVGIVEGDDILGRMNSGDEKIDLRALEKDGPALREIQARLTSANVYLGARPIVEALRDGAQIVVTGRCTDTGLTLAPMIHEFGIAEDDWDALALGTILGHIMECGAQASGGNFLGDWRAIPAAEKIGFPIAEVYGRDRAVITKHASLGGLVSAATVKEQLMYEIGDPRSYLTPDCVADFTTIRLKEIGKNRVELTGVRGRPAPETLKVSCVYDDGWKVTGQITYVWPEAKAKALAAGALIKRRVEQVVDPKKFEEWRIEAVGADACLGALVADAAEPQEVTLRISTRSADRAACDYVGRELVPLVLTGPPGATGFAGGRPRASSVAAYWSGLIPREQVKPVVEVLEA
jgi:hypothetical protein